MANANLDALRKVYDALESGDFATVMSLLSDAITAHVPGTSPVGGEYVGKEAVGGYVGKLAELSGGTLRFEPHDVLATDTHGVGLVKDLAERGEKSLAMNNVHVWHITNGALDEFWIYPGDLYAWDEFWS
jgi:ketosteroid isomerase-like protein